MILNPDQLQIQADISRKLFENLDSDEAITIVCQELLKVFDYTTVTISLYDNEKKSVEVMAEFDRNSKTFPATPPYNLSEFPTTKKVIVDQEVFCINISDPDADPIELKFLKDYNDKCLLMIPLVFQGDAIGLIEFWDSVREHQCSPEDLPFIRSTCDIAAGAVHNFLFVDQILRQKNEMSLLFGAAEKLTANIDYREALKVITENILTIFDVAYVDFLFVDKDNDEVEVITSAVNPEAGESTYVEGERFKISDWPYINECIQTASPKTLYIDDPDLTESGRKELEEWNENASVAIPVLYKGNVLGIIEVVETRRIIRYKEADIHLAAVLADFAATILNNLLLFEETSKRNNEMATVMDVMKDITSSVDINQVLQNLTSRLCRTLDLSGVDIYFYDPETQQYRANTYTANELITPDWKGLYKIGEFPFFDQCIQEQCITTVQRNDPDLDTATIVEMDKWGEKSALAVPMVCNEEIIGVAYLYERRYNRLFSEDAKRLASIIISQGSIAIENARNYDLEQKARKNQELLNRRLGAIIEMSDQLRGISDINESLAFIGQRISYDMGTMSRSPACHWYAVRLSLIVWGNRSISSFVHSYLRLSMKYEFDTLSA